MTAVGETADKPSMSAVGSERTAEPRGPLARRLANQALLWAGPLGLGLAALVLLLSAPFFRSGPGVPTAGDERAWNAMWGALGLVALGTAAGFIASLVWLAIAIRGKRRPSPLEWFRTATGLVLGVASAVMWFRS